MKKVMVRAWEIAKNAVVEFGGKVVEYLSGALEMAWAEIKKGANNMKTFEEQRNTIYRDSDLTKKQLDLVNSYNDDNNTYWKANGFNSFADSFISQWRDNGNLEMTIEEYVEYRIARGIEMEENAKRRQAEMDTSAAKYIGEYEYLIEKMKKANGMMEQLNVMAEYNSAESKLRRNKEIDKAEKKVKKHALNITRKQLKKIMRENKEVFAEPVNTKTVTGPVYDDDAKPSYF